MAGYTLNAKAGPIIAANLFDDLQRIALDSGCLAKAEIGGSFLTRKVLNLTVSGNSRNVETAISGTQVYIDEISQAFGACLLPSKDIDVRIHRTI